MHVETAARKHCLSDPTITGYVGQKVYKHRLEEMVDQTSGVALVISTNGGWGVPDPRQTAHFPLVRFDCYADSSRDAAGEIITVDAPDKAKALLDAVDRMVHGKRGVMWGGPNGLWIVSAARWREPTLTTHNDLHGKQVNLGDSVFWRGEYALETA